MNEEYKKGWGFHILNLTEIILKKVHGTKNSMNKIQNVKEVRAKYKVQKYTTEYKKDRKKYMNKIRPTTKAAEQNESMK